MKTISRYIMTLALLLTAVTGAWAADTFTITFSANGKNKTYTDVVLPAEYKCEYGSPGELDKIIQELYEQDGGHAIENAAPTVTGTTAIITGLEGPNNYAMITIIAPFTGKATVSGTYAGWSNKSGNSDINYSIEVYFGTPSSEPAITVEWNPATKTGSFVMPAYDVEIAPIYAPTAEFATDGEPTAIEGIIAGEAKDIVKAGTVATTKIGEADPIAQGTVMYAVTTENKKPTSTTGFSATVPTGAALTGSYTENQTVYVWYYLKGIDAAEGVTPTAENTFNDSEICETPLTVKLKANQFTLTLDPAPVKNITVTAGTETKTPTTEGKTDIKMGSEVKLKANEGYKFRKVEVKKNPVAEGHALTSAKFGEIVCSDGKAYAAADKDILPKDVKAEALVCYVDGDHGLALAMADVKNEKMSWDNDRGANDDKTAAQWCDGWNTSHPIAGATWLLASQTQWNNMISAAGSASNLSNAFSAVGGTNLQAWSYWSSTTLHSGTAAYLYYFPSSSWQWVYFNGEGDNGCYIRACLEW